MRSLDLYIECSTHQELPKQGCGVILNFFVFVWLQTNLRRHLFAQKKIAEKRIQRLNHKQINFFKKKAGEKEKMSVGINWFYCWFYNVQVL